MYTLLHDIPTTIIMSKASVNSLPLFLMTIAYHDNILDSIRLNSINMCTVLSIIIEMRAEPGVAIESL